MKRAWFLVLACVAVGAFVASSTFASHNIPKSAKKTDESFVTAYNQCTAPTLTHRPSLALPACVPAASSANDPANVYEFGFKNGNADGSLSVKLQAVADGLNISVKSKAVLRNGALYTGNDLIGTATVRMTDDDGCGAAFDTDCTTIDFLAPFGLTCTAGSCKTAVSVTPAYIAYEPFHDANIEVGQIEIIDQDGDAVARTGLLVP